LIFRLPRCDFSYAEMIHAADFQHDQFAAGKTPDGGCRPTLEHRLFPGTLEKGVILRSRIRGLFVPRAEDCAQAAADYRQFLHSPLPLTT
jgi:hypothetical protein